ncbi:LytTR family transcriptional regulator [Lacihabitans sp. CCS-44]|uniref:LytR/AlgR family response regulator transcription factor n=1 Tax=Lacihabitans sp. CCS-44 TaxID=2487331 RepID=UPI0020CD092B|nr:LytTR family DNA-binding domain-containing protein [Lacihabitans sp. CCS-44]MCP9757636.1 LytTR family transcriptional regulator [Lacihabitans sp. CCS-44]
MFFVFFQPFDISEWSDPNKFLKLIGFALITSISTYFHRQAIPSLFPKFHEEKNWVIWKEILGVLILLLIITTGNVAYGSAIFKWEFSLSNWLTFFGWVLGIGIFPTVFWVLADYIYQLKKYSKPVVIKDIKDEMAEEKLKLVAENEKDFVELRNKELLYIESSDNYSSIVYLKDQNIEKTLLRSSLTRIESQIADENIVRTHRSFIVNLDHVIKVSGNAQGYKLHLKFTDFLVPVARKFSFLIEKLR